MAVVVFLAIVLPVYGQEESSKPGSDKTNGNGSQSPPSTPLGTATCVVKQEGTAIECQWPEAEPKSYFKRLFSPENAPNIGLVFVGMGGIIAAVFTLLAIKEQTNETAKAATATEAAVVAAETSYKLARDTSERELRAYLTVSNARLFLYEDGSVEPRLTITNSGQSPAYKLRGWQTISFDGHRHDISFKPSDDFLLHYGTVGKIYRLTGQKHGLATNKQEIINHIRFGGMVIVLTGCYWYDDIFDKPHPLTFQLVIGGNVMSRANNSKYDWLVFFDDPLAGYFDQQRRQNPN